MEPRSTFVMADGLRTHVLEAGAGETLVLVHGGGAGADSRGNWRQCYPRLAARYRVLAVDMPGFGQTEKPDPAAYEYSQPARNAHLAAVVRALAPEGAHLVGNSMGGATCLGVAMAEPALVRSLTLMGSAGLTTRLSPEIRTILSYQPTPENMRLLVATLTSPAFKVENELLAYRYELTRQPGTMAAYAAIMRWLAEQGGLFYPEEAIRGVRAPTLVVQGREDRVVPKELGWRFMELIDDARLHVIPHCGHWAMIERTAEFCAVVLAFIDGLAGERRLAGAA